MTRKLLLAFLVLALLLAVGALVLLRGDGPERRSFGKVVEFDPAALAEIRVRPAGLSEERLVRGKRGWRFDDPQGGWPIEEARLSAALELIAGAEGESTNRLDPEFRAGGSVAFVLAAAGGEVLVELPERMLAGRAILRVRGADGTSRMVTSDALFPTLFGGGVGSWRDARLLPGLGPDASRIAIEAGGSRFVLASIRSRWSMLEPVAAPASRQAIDRLFGTLAALEARSFVEPGTHDRATMGLDPPSGTLELRLSPRSGEGGEPDDLDITLRLGAPTDLVGDGRFAEIVLSGGTHAVITSRSILERIIATPEAYISGRTLEVPAAEVAGLDLRAPEDEAALEASARPRIVRSRDRWTMRAEDAPPIPLSDADGAAVGELVLEICETDAPVVRRTRPPSFIPMARVIAFDAGRAPLADMVLGVGRGEEGGGIGDRWVLTTRLGGVYRMYPPGAGSRALEWLRTVVPRTEPSPP